MSTETGATDDRGLSELVGVVILFGVVAVAAVSVVVMGSTLQEDMREESEFESARMGMQELDSRLGSLSYGTGGDAHLDLSDSTDDRVRVAQRGSTVEFRLNGKDACSASVDTGAVVYEADDGDRLAYEAGAVWEVTGGEPTMVSPPDLGYSDGTVNFDVAVLRGSAGEEGLDISANRSGSLSATERFRTDLLRPLGECTPRERLTIAVTGPYHEAWYDYLTGEMPDGTVTDHDDNDTVVVHLDDDDLTWGVGDDDGDDGDGDDDAGDDGDDGDGDRGDAGDDGEGEDEDGNDDGENEDDGDDGNDGDDADESTPRKPIDVVFVYEGSDYVTHSLEDSDYNLSTFTANLRSAGLEPKYGGGYYFGGPHLGRSMQDPSSFDLTTGYDGKQICTPQRISPREAANNRGCPTATDRRDLTDALYEATSVDYNASTPTVVVHVGRGEALSPRIGEYPTYMVPVERTAATHTTSEAATAIKNAGVDFYSVTPARKTLYYGCNGNRHHDAREIANKVGGTWIEENGGRACGNSYGGFDLDSAFKQIQGDLVDQYAPDRNSSAPGGVASPAPTVASVTYGNGLPTVYVSVPEGAGSTAFSGVEGCAGCSASSVATADVTDSGDGGAASTTAITVRISHVEVGDDEE